MIAFMKSLWRDKRGNALVIAAASLPLVLGSAGLASDTIEWALWKRQLQRAADSAAMAGVYAKVHSETAAGAPTYTAAVTADLAHNNHVGITTAVMSISPPPNGAFSADDMAVRVTLAVQMKLSFSSLFLSTPPTIRATATATIVPSGQYCVVSLENTLVTGINATGSTNVNLGCGMITNSASQNAAVATGSSNVVASPIAAVGGIPASNNWGAGTTLQPFSANQADPFNDPNGRTVNPPTGVSCSGADVNIANNQTQNFGTNVDSVTCMTSLTIAGTTTLRGTIYIDGGNVRIGTQANVTCDQCTIVMSNHDNSPTATIGNFEVVGSPQMHWTAPTSGTYAGLLIYQDRRAIDQSDTNHQNFLRGSSSSYFEGAFYFPKQQLEFSGTTGMNTQCLQLVSRRVVFTGNSAISNTCPAGSGARSFAGRRVRLVE
jgi:Flp pilus assembly protein TadG